MSTLTSSYDPIVAGKSVDHGEVKTVNFPATGEPIADFHVADQDTIELALASVARSARSVARMPAWRRSEILLRASELVRGQADGLVEKLVLETGKPVREARVEVARAVTTLRLGAEEATRVGGEIVPLDNVPAGEGRLGEVRRFPVGPVAGITPFNSPFNLACHKAAGALAAGCPLLLKPSPRTPLTTIELGRLLLDANWPAEALAVLPGGAETAQTLVRDDRVRAVAFNGSVEVGWSLRAMAGSKRVVLELGGTGAVIIAADADIEFAARRCVEAGYLLAGQVCASVQRIYVDRTVHEAFVSELVRLSEASVIGDPREPEVTVGPLIDVREAERVESIVTEAAELGATVRTGGQRTGTFIAPTVLDGVTSGMRAESTEVFGPVLGVRAVAGLDEAVAAVNASPYGMQAGIFTESLSGAYRAYRDLDMAGVIVNDVNTWRIDSMPFGGEKESGLGREGPRSLALELTYPKLLVLNFHEGR